MRLLCTDMDRTIIPNGDQPESPCALRWLAQLIEEAGLKLGYVTGRDLGRILEGINEWSLPTPDIIVADVGTSIYRREGSDWVLDQTWQKKIAAHWKNQNRHAVAAALTGVDRLTAQPEDRQKPFKMSYTLALDVEVDALIPHVRALLESHGLHSSLVYSVDPEANVGLFDVLPAEATKRHAVEYLRDSARLGNTNILFSGDSGNDLDVLQSPVPSVLVANADAPTRQAAIEGADRSDNSSSLFLASGDLSSFDLSPTLTMQLNGNYSAGILEGLFHHWPDLIDRFRNMVRDAPRYTAAT